jgi:uncharacterized protein (DUF362 family)
MGETRFINKENRTYLGISQDAVYPNSNEGYSPNVEYPEYIFGKTHLSNENQVYELVREGFFSLGYDQRNYGTSTWNPLGEFIKEGQTVLIKPNWVMHYNKNKDYHNNLECLVTHPSIVRAVIDYALVALKGTGRLLVADAPMQGCDLKEMFSKSGYEELFEFYRSRGINIEVLDLRQLRVITSNKVITDTIIVNGEDQSIKIEVNEASAHSAKSNMQYKVSDYLAESTNTYHHDNVHTYNINRNVLQADVIINMPKPKCHRLAGITAAQKNMVGITYDKACLPHRTIGARTSGGDEYPNRSTIKTLISKVEERKLRLTKRGKSLSAIILQFLIFALYLAGKLFSKDKIMLGSWYGNDTIWRTVADLNLIAEYADKNGILQNVPQRKILNIADMIVAGQGSGPIGPHPKYLGIVLIGEDSSFFDAICAKIMGFDIGKIPGLKYLLENNRLNRRSIKRIVSNNLKYDNILFEDFIPAVEWRFDPHECWKGNIENY